MKRIQAPRKLTALFGLLFVALLGLIASATDVQPMSATDLAFADDTQPNPSIELSKSILVDAESDFSFQSRGQQFVLINGSLGSGGGTLQSSLYQMEGSVGDMGASELNRVCPT